MGVSSRRLTQVVTYWGKGADNVFGVSAFQAPILLRGRWEDRVEVVRNAQGDDYTSKAVVFLSQDVEENGYVALGDFTTEADPRQANIPSYEVMAVAKVPDLRALSNEVRAYL